MKKNIKYLAVLALGLVACEPEFKNPVDEAGTYTSGEANFSNYMSLGDSLTAGYGAGALFTSGQQNSYPNILSQQFAYAGGGAFMQPLMADNAGGLLLGGSVVLNPLTGENVFPNRFVLAFDENGENPGPSVYTGAAGTTEISNVLTGPFNNMGIPGAKSFQLEIPGFGNLANFPNANPYFIRMASSPDAKVIDDAVAQNPTFFSLWVGNNDILGYSTSGATGLDHNVTGNEDTSTYGPSDLTNNTAFANVYRRLLIELTANGAKGVVFSLPNVTSIPFLTTVPYNPLAPKDANGDTTPFGAQVPTLNGVFEGLNAVYDAFGVPERFINFSATEVSPVVILDESLTDMSAQITGGLIAGGADAELAAIFGQQFGQARQATPSDLLGLRSRGVIGQVDFARVAELMGMGLSQAAAGQFSITGVSLPLADVYVLTADEQVGVNAAVASFNATIKELAAEYDLAFYDVASDLERLANGGISFNGGVLTSDFVTGGAFSLDGVHSSPRGNALIANRTMGVVEAKYGAKLPRVAVGDYGTVTLSNDVN